MEYHSWNYSEADYLREMSSYSTVLTFQISFVLDLINYLELQFITLEMWADASAKDKSPKIPTAEGVDKI